MESEKLIMRDYILLLRFRNCSLASRTWDAHLVEKGKQQQKKKLSTATTTTTTADGSCGNVREAQQAIAERYHGRKMSKYEFDNFLLYYYTHCRAS